MEEKELEELAGQLMCPSGAKGVEVATMMNATNSGMTFNSIGNLPLEAGMKILEIGPGNAGHLEHLFGKQRDLVYTGLDISELMVTEAAQLNRSSVTSGKASFVLYNGSDIPFEDESFDGVFTVNTIYFWENPVSFLEEIKRVMKPGAAFALTFADASFMETLPFTKFVFTLYDSGKVSELAAQAGLTIATTDVQHEMVKSKTGEQVERRFTTLLLVK